MPHIKTSNQDTLVLGFGDYTCNWGLHICGLYETEAERDDIVFGFLSEGARQRELQLYCPSERSPQNFMDTFSAKYPELANQTRDPNAFQIMNARDLYYPEGVFSPWKMDEGLNAFYEESQKNGARNVRATAEMVWALDAIPGVEHLMAYESRLNYFIPGKPWISICLYNLTRFSGETIMQVLQTHPYSITNGRIVENPYYQNPDTWLSDHAPEFLSR